VKSLDSNIKILTKESLEDLYWRKGMTLEQIGREYGTSGNHASQIMKKRGVKIKSRKELGLKFSDDYSNVNVNFFMRNTPELAYIAGLLATDGHMYSTGSGNRFSLGMTDKDVIEWVAEKIGVTNKIYTNTSGKLPLYRIAFSNHKVKEMLVNQYKITPKKSLTLQFPKLNACQYSHFLRGVFDGDGSVGYDKRNILSVSMSSASKDFINGIKEIVDNIIGYDVNILKTHTQKGEPYYRYSFFGIDKAKKFHDWLYENGVFGSSRRKEQLECAMTKYINKYNERREFKNKYIVNGDSTVIYCKYKDKLHEVLIDTDDLAKLIENGGSWYVGRKNERYFVQQHNRLEENKKFLLLKRFLLEISDNVSIGHIDGNPYNCKKGNIVVKKYSSEKIY